MMIKINSPYGEICVEEVENIKIDLDYLEFELFDTYDKQITLLVFSVISNRIPENFSILSYKGDVTVWAGKTSVSKYKITTPIKEFFIIF